MSLVAYYDLSCCPVSYDVVSFLMLAERERIRRGHEAIEIEILPGPADGFRRDHLWPYTTWERRHILHNVVVPMCELLPAVTKVTVHGQRDAVNVPGSIGYGEYTISFEEFCKTYALEVRPLRAKRLTPFPGHRTVTMTLRECDHWPERNSAVVEWLRAADKLSKDVKVIVVRDTAKADQDPSLLDCYPGQALYFNPNAAKYMMDRAELYASCDLNLFVNNGPAWLSLALDAPTIVFRPVTETKCYAHTAEAMRKFGVPTNGQMKGHPEHQYLCWEPETAENIVSVVQQFFAKAEVMV